MIAFLATRSTTPGAISFTHKPTFPLHVIINSRLRDAAAWMINFAHLSADITSLSLTETLPYRFAICSERSFTSLSGHKIRVNHCYTYSIFRDFNTEGVKKAYHGMLTRSIATTFWYSILACQAGNANNLSFGLLQER